MQPSVLESRTFKERLKDEEEERKFRGRCQTSENKACARRVGGVGKSEEMAVWVSTAGR